MEDLVARIAASAGIEDETARQAIGIILAFVRKEGPTAEVDELFATVPGAPEAAAASQEAGGAGGMLSGLMGMMGSGLVGLAGRLTALGLSMEQMQAIGREVFAYVREKAGDERVGQVAAAIPGLSQFL
jgi:predicted lipid-binding transport protein (Tim44 family)